jgi:hypothetical protein
MSHDWVGWRFWSIAKIRRLHKLPVHTHSGCPGSSPTLFRRGMTDAATMTVLIGVVSPWGQWGSAHQSLLPKNRPRSVAYEFPPGLGLSHDGWPRIRVTSPHLRSIKKSGCFAAVGLAAKFLRQFTQRIEPRMTHG